MPPVILISSPLEGVFEPGHPGSGCVQHPAHDCIAGKQEAGILRQEADRIVPRLQQQRPVLEEIGNLEAAALPGRNWFSYVRYNRSYMGRSGEELLRKTPQLADIDAVRAMPSLREIGRAYAEEHVRIEHLI